MKLNFLDKKTIILYGMYLKKYYKDKDFILSLINALLVLVVALIINHFAAESAHMHGGPALRDSVLDSFPKVNTNFIDSYVTLYLQFFVFVVAFFYPKKLVSFLLSVSVLVVVRDIFVNMTYLGLPPLATPTTSFFTQGEDLFFSGHTALPFMAALIYWETPFLRFLFLFFTIFMGVQVLIGHHHYTIDVLSAPFITYGIYKICQRFSLGN